VTQSDTIRFPDGIPPGGRSIPTTIDNIAYLLDRAGITVRYNVIKKKNEYRIPDHRGTSENLDNVAVTKATDLAAKAGLGTGLVPDFVHAVADRNAFNPVADWICSREWDGEDRLPAFFATIVSPEDYPNRMKELLLHKWLRSAAAAAILPRGFRSRGVLTFQGPQGVGKTSWVRSLIGETDLRDSVIKLDHHMDGSNKDSVIGAISHWIVEIGELDSSFKKDVARLKGFITSDFDRIRRPYARADSEYPRRTVFVATVNDAQFLTDHTGNSRWWTIPVEKLDFDHGINMQQLFAQVAKEVDGGAEWWLDPDEEIQMEAWNRRHRSVSAIAEKILDELDLDRRDHPSCPPLTPTELLERIGFRLPISNPHAKEAGAVLREVLGPPKRINGRDRWRIPFQDIDLNTWKKPLRPKAEPDKF
jgi:putative DNA primase/helicase